MKNDKPRPKKRKFPCIIYELQPHNPEYHDGFRYRMHDLDDDQWLFVDKDRLAWEIDLHSFRPVPVEKMEELRRRNSV